MTDPKEDEGDGAPSEITESIAFSDDGEYVLPAGAGLGEYLMHPWRYAHSSGNNLML
jgi:hypothetical protein